MKMENKLGFHYFQDTDHFQSKDLSLWLPQLKSLNTAWLIIKSPINIAIPEEFISGLLEMLEIMELIARKQNISLKLAAYNPQKYVFVTQLLENVIRGFPPLAYWTDFIAENRLCALDSMPRIFGINPVRFHNHIDYLNLSSRKRKK